MPIQSSEEVSQLVRYLFLNMKERKPQKSVSKNVARNQKAPICWRRALTLAEPALSSANSAISYIRVVVGLIPISRLNIFSIFNS